MSPHGLRHSSTHAAGLRIKASETEHRMRDGNGLRILFLSANDANAIRPLARSVAGHSVNDWI